MAVRDAYPRFMADEKLDKKTVSQHLLAARSDLVKVVKNNEFLKEKLTRVKQEGLIFAAHVLATAEIVGAAFGMGFMRGYYGEKAVILGLPIDAAAGLLLHGVAYGLGFAGGRTAKFVAANFHNLANGALATWSAAAGAQLGYKKKSTAQEDPAAQQVPPPPAPPQPAQGGEFPAVGANPQLMPPQMTWGPWAGMAPGMQANPWGAMPAIPQQQGSPMTQEELAAAMAWQQAAA